MDDDNKEEVSKMTDSEALNEIRNSLSGILKHIDGSGISKKEEKGDDKMNAKMYNEDKEDKEMDDKEMEKSTNDALAYIDQLEKFAHEKGVDLDGLRSHFGLEKAYMVGVDGQGGYSHRGMGDEIGAGEDATEVSYPALAAPGGNKYVIKNGGVPNMAYNAPSGNNNVIKSGEITQAGLEKGYAAYAALRDEESVKTLVKSEWESRYEAETARALEVHKSKDYGGQIATLKAEIANLKTENTEIQKSASVTPTTDIRVPSNEEFAAMGSDIDGWRAAEDLARRAFRGE